MIRRLRSFFLLVLVVSPLLSSCNTLTLTYNYADWIFLWRIDHYFDISSEQKQRLKPRLNGLHQWHRETELPQYANFLRHIHRAWQDGFTVEELDHLFNSYQKLYNHLARRIASEGSYFLATLNADQLRYLEESMRENHEEILEEIGKSREARLDRRREKIFDWLEYFLGSLDEDQREIITHFIENLPDTTSAWLNHRAYRQQQFIQLLRTGPDPTTLADHIGMWLTTPPQDTQPDYAEGTKRMERASKTLILAVDKLLTPEQRQHGLATLRDLIQDLESLSST